MKFLYLKLFVIEDKYSLREFQIKLKKILETLISFKIAGSDLANSSFSQFFFNVARLIFHWQVRIPCYNVSFTINFQGVGV